MKDEDEKKNPRQSPQAAKPNPVSMFTRVKSIEAFAKHVEAFDPTGLTPEQAEYAETLKARLKRALGV